MMMLALVVGFLFLVVVTLVIAARAHSSSTDALPGQLRPPAPSANATPHTVVELARAGRLIDAIKLHREQTGLGLKEAKDAVEAMRDGREPERAAPAAATHAGSGDTLTRVTALLAAGQKIEAIKLYREATGVDLKAAKDAVEALERR
jgi:ribosomal protein L7/L12